CSSIACTSDTCNTGFPSGTGPVPPPESGAPTLPLYSCEGTGLNFEVNFCPGGFFP
ncbi:hypothetical protein CPB83DRAFT_730109, partial [Crepidotus variabilis]